MLLAATAMSLQVMGADSLGMAYLWAAFVAAQIDL